MVTIVEIGPGIRRERSMPGLHWKATPMVFGTLLVRTDGSVRFSAPNGYLVTPPGGRLEMFAAPFPWGGCA